MSKKSGSQRRLEFFDRGNRACPICLKEFSRGGVEAGQNVTLEHAPPKAIGGSVACLTCDSCNRRASGSVDIAVALHQRATEHQKTGRGTQIEIDVFGTKHTTFMSTPNAPTSNPTKWLQQHDNAEQLRKQLANKEVLIFAELTRGLLGCQDWSFCRLAATWRRPRVFRKCAKRTGKPSGIQPTVVYPNSVRQRTFFRSLPASRFATHGQESIRPSGRGSERVVRPWS